MMDDVWQWAADNGVVGGVLGLLGGAFLALVLMYVGARRP